jgi:hypothetical protein
MSWEECTTASASNIKHQFSQNAQYFEAIEIKRANAFSWRIKSKEDIHKPGRVAFKYEKG